MLNKNKNILDGWFSNKQIPYFYNPGALGDIIYSIPFCLSCIGVFNKQQHDLAKFNFVLDPLIKTCTSDNHKYYKSLLSLKQLLSTQKYLNQILVFEHRIDFGTLYNAIDLGQIRKKLVDMKKGDIQLRYHFIYRTLKHYKLDDPWIILNKDQKYKQFNNKIIVFRTSRYRNRSILNYNMLKKYQKNIIYIGNENQYRQFCEQTMFKPQYHQTNSFLQVANIINNCAFVVGNQTSYFAIAEALKVPRLCQMSTEIPDVIPKGDFANDFVNNDDLKICLDLYANEFLK